MAGQQTKRRFRRALVPPQFLLRCWGEGFRGRVRVLSEGGAFIDTIHPSPPGAEFDATIEAGDAIRVRCISRDLDPGWGMGVEFVALAESDRTRLQDLVGRFL
jgi:hypothetical protein